MAGRVPLLGKLYYSSWPAMVNSSVLGKIRIGDRVRIGANTAVATNVPSDSTVIGSPARIFPRLTPFGPAGASRAKTEPEGRP